MHRGQDAVQFRAGVQRDAEGQSHVYYGVTENGIHGPWRAVVGMKE